MEEINVNREGIDLIDNYDAWPIDKVALCISVAALTISTYWYVFSHASLLALLCCAERWVSKEHYKNDNGEKRLITHSINDLPQG